MPLAVVGLNVQHYLSRTSTLLSYYQRRHFHWHHIRMQGQKVQSHYEGHTAASYESAFFYEEGEYNEHLRDLVIQRLCLDMNLNRKSRRLLDIGGGPRGSFTSSLVKKCPHLHAVVVDPFLKFDQKSHGERIHFVKEPAEIFMQPPGTETKDWWRRDYHQVLMKEVVHHLKPLERIPIFQGIRENLSNALTKEDKNIPSLLIITRPQKDIDYPLWKEAKEVWAKNQPDVEDLVQDLIKAGFSDIRYTVESYPCSVSLERWQSMVKQRFWSTFANFSDSELETACTTIAKSEVDRIDDKGCIHFEDRLIFMLANQ